MLKSFYEFINESVVKYSDQFRSILKEIDGTTISKKLLEIENNDHDVSFNFIDIGYDIDSDTEFITFTPDQKAQKFLQDGGDEDQVYNHIRQSVKVAKGVKSLLKSINIEFSDSQIEYFVNKFKSKVKFIKERFDFELVKGESIAHWYSLAQYEQGEKGPLGNSCMRSMPSETFGIYTKNPDVVSLLILKSTLDPSKISGRALVWNIGVTTAESDYENVGGLVFMDRIYCHSDSDVELFRSYAIENGMYYKQHNDSDEDCNLVGKEVTLSDVKLVVNLKKNYNTSDRFPYMDTLKYLDTDDGELTNDEDRNDDHITLESTDGTYEECECDSCGGSELIDCDNCGGSGEFECDDCDGDGELECEECDGSGTIDGEECEECDGSGENPCGNCGGDGEVNCDECGGDGSIECPECC
jgi:hypothetical protein